MLYVHIIILHVDINESHVNIIMLHVDLNVSRKYATIDKRLLDSVFFYCAGNTESFRSMADRFDVGKSSYHRSMKRVACALVDDIMP